MNPSIAVRRVRPADYPGFATAFAELSRRAPEPNPHMAPAAVEAAGLFVDDDAIVILAAWLSEALGSDRLAGIWVLRRQRDWRSGFAAVLSSPLLPLYEVSSAPVLDRDHAHDVASALLRHIKASRDLPKVLALPLLPLQGPVFDALAEACRITAGRLSTYETWSRPMMLPQPGDDAERYLRRSLGSGYKKRMQQFRAITRDGEVTVRRLRGERAREAFEGFLTLEAAGWKGKAGTAIACLPADAAYFRKLVALFAAQDGLQVDTLLLSGQAIAMGVLIECAGSRHFLKIAYDETQSRHSPGRALTVAMIRADFAGSADFTGKPPVHFDSGAGDGVDPSTYVWGERRTMANAVIGLGRRRECLPQLAAFARRTLRTLRARLKR